MAVALLALMTGCGGGGGGVTNSVYAGSWKGPWNDSSNAQSGTLNVTVAQNGNISGQILNSTSGQTGSTTGTVQNNGTISATYTYPSVTYTASGNVAIGSNGHLTGTVQEFRNGSQVGTATFDLTKQ